MNILRAVKGTTHSEIENKVRAATSNESISATTTQLMELANATYQHKLYDDLYPQLCTRLSDFSCPQHCFKSLLVCLFLILHGDVKFVNDIRLNDTLHDLTQYHFFKSGIEIGDKIRQKAQECIDLLSNNDLLRQKRIEARRTIQSIIGFGNTDPYNSPTERSHAVTTSNPTKYTTTTDHIHDTGNDTGYISSYSNVKREKVTTPKKPIHNKTVQWNEVDTGEGVDVYVVPTPTSNQFKPVQHDPFLSVASPNANTNINTPRFDPFLENPDDFIFDEAFDRVSLSQPAKSQHSQTSSPQLQNQNPKQQQLHSQQLQLPQPLQQPHQPPVYTRTTNRGRSSTSASISSLELGVQRPSDKSTTKSNAGSPVLSALSPQLQPQLQQLPPSQQQLQLQLQQQQQQQQRQQQQQQQHSNQALFSPQNEMPQQSSNNNQRPTSSGYDHFGSLQQQAYQHQHQQHQQQQNQFQQQAPQPAMVLVAIQPQQFDPFCQQYDAFSNLSSGQNQSNIQSINNAYHRPTSASVSNTNAFNSATTYNPKQLQQSTHSQEKVDDTFDFELPF